MSQYKGINGYKKSTSKVRLVNNIDADISCTGTDFT